MATNVLTYREQVIEEINQTPIEHLPYLVQIIRIFRESLTLKPAEESFKQGWREALRGETKPVSELWEGIDAE
jgi:hypothetical protein